MGEKVLEGTAAVGSLAPDASNGEHKTTKKREGTKKASH